ncbi:MAG: oxidoreductase [Gemmatimonadota bacterium]|nr:oxidoreductase [Gemmatimonadota bacterium]
MTLDRPQLRAIRRCAVSAALAAVAACPAALSAQWSMAGVPTTAEFRGLSLADRRTLWASGMHGTVARSVDGGATWTVTTIPGADSLDLRSIVALGPDVAVAASAGPAERGQARIYRTEDAGAHWRQVFTTDERGVFLDALAFWDRAHGIAMSDPVNGRLVLLTTDDGGRSWQAVPADALPPALPNEGGFAASNSSIALWGSDDAWIGTGGAARARVYRSTDRGRSWQVSDTPVHAGTPASGIFALAFRDARHGVAVGGDYTQPHAATTNVAVTDDGGVTWRAARGPLAPAYLSGVAFTGGRTYVAVGLAGTAVSADDGESWTLVDTLPLDAVRALGGLRAASGPRGRLGRWSGGR